ncbi:MAG: hypothetical protein GF398_01620 [Chitinivibrionales bacterium]|nr:hypothetical protein [Chitinivibrionales bacterium]
MRNILTDTLGFLIIAALVPAISCGETSFKLSKDASEGHANGVQAMDAADLNGDGRADVVAICGGKHANSSIFAWFEAPSSVQGT